MKRFFNRREAGMELAEKPSGVAGRHDVIVLGLADRHAGVPLRSGVS